MAADALENALIAALPLGPQSPAGGVSLPDSFHGELQARRRAADPTSYPRASRPLPANLPARAGPYARAGAPACRDCAAGARPAHGAAGGACGAPRPAAAPRACATGRLRKSCDQGRWARQRARTGAGRGARAAGCRLARARAQVTLLEARNLPVWGFPWQSNPYARVALGGQAVRSRRDDDTSHAGRHRAPVWNQEFQFLVEDPAAQARAVPTLTHPGHAPSRAPVWNQEFQFLVEDPAAQARAVPTLTYPGHAPPSPRPSGTRSSSSWWRTRPRRRALSPP